MVKPVQAFSKERPVPAVAPLPASVSSTELMRGRQEIVIVHQGKSYRLQQTRNGKLILTK